MLVRGQHQHEKQSLTTAEAFRAVRCRALIEKLEVLLSARIFGGARSASHAVNIPMQLHVANFLRSEFRFAITSRLGLLARSTQQSDFCFQPINILGVRSEEFLFSV